MIPKIIHYCWFGRNPIPEKDKKCIESWKRFCPDYKIIEWNEDNFDVTCCDYVREAYEAKKWAFVSDYVRIWALYEYGGIYMDTDVEVLKNLDNFLAHKAFTGFESEKLPFTAVAGSEPYHPFINAILNSYNTRHFKVGADTYDTTTNTETVSDLLVKKYKINTNNKLQVCEEIGLTVYPNDFFCPKSYIDNKVHLTKNSYTIHWYNASWQSDEEKRYHILNARLSRIFGVKLSDIMLGIYTCVKREGFSYYIKKRLKRLIKK